LQRLGDLAAQKGDTAAASNYYKQALDVTRSLSASAPVP
jgi:predicted negative regulator of RcsB-dependent stress response